MRRRTFARKENVVGEVWGAGGWKEEEEEEEERGVERE